MGIGTYILVSIVKILLAVFILLTAVAYTVLLERKVVAHMQNRWGPSRVGPFGIWQPLADGKIASPVGRYLQWKVVLEDGGEVSGVVVGP